LKKWVEIGNSGMFRPEMLEAMGLPKDVRVHGWGLSLERYLSLVCWRVRLLICLDLRWLWLGVQILESCWDINVLLNGFRVSLLLD